MAEYGIFLCGCGLAWIVVVVFIGLKRKKQKELEKKEDEFKAFSFHKAVINIPPYDDIKILILPDENNKRSAVFASSHSYWENHQKLQDLQKIIPQAYDIKKTDQFCVKVCATPAADFRNIERVISDFIIRELKSCYKWMEEVQKVSVEIKNEDLIFLYLPDLHFGTHKDLWRSFSLKGIGNASYDDNHYNVRRDSNSKWSDIKIEIEKSLSEYFVGGYEIVGKWPSDEEYPPTKTF